MVNIGSSLMEICSKNSNNVTISGDLLFPLNETFVIIHFILDGSGEVDSLYVILLGSKICQNIINSICGGIPYSQQYLMGMIRPVLKD